MKKVLVAISTSAIFLLVRMAAGQSLDDQLLHAADIGDFVAVQTLLQQGANVEAKATDGSYSGWTALLLATNSNHIDVVKLLLDKGANIEAKTPPRDNGWPALIIASYAGHTDLIKLLLDRGADIEVRDSGGKTALMTAVESVYGKTEAVELLINKGANLEAKDKDGNTALILMAVDGKTDSVRLLLDKGANPDTKDDQYGATALIAAAAQGKTDVVKLLLERGSNIEAKDKDGDTALMVADRRGKTDVVMLIQQAASQDPREKSLTSALAMNPPPEVPAEAKMHMSRGIAAVEGAKTPNDFKVACNEFQQVVALAPWLPNGYRNLAIAQDKAGMYDEALINLRLYLLTKPSAADAAWAEDMQSTIAFRKQKLDLGITLLNALSTSGKDINMQEALELISRGADVNVKDRNGEPLLKYAISFDLTEIIRAALDNGADVNETNNFGRTPLMTAVLGKVEIVQLLISRGANVNAVDQDGETALMTCSCGNMYSGSSPDAPEIEKLLIDSGANVNARDKKGNTVLNWVEGWKCNHPEMAQILRAAGAR